MKCSLVVLSLVNLHKGVSSRKYKIEKEYFTCTTGHRAGRFILFQPGTPPIICHVKLFSVIWTDLNMKRGPSVTFIVCFSLSPIITQFILVFHKQFIALKHLLFWLNNECWLGLYSIMRPSWSDGAQCKQNPSCSHNNSLQKVHWGVKIIPLCPLMTALSLRF